MDATVDISTITDPNWQLSNTEFGQVAIGVDDLQMCVHNILFTRKGEMPLDMQAGSNLYMLVDKPLNIIIPGVTSEVIDAINNQEPRLQVVSVVPTFTPIDGSVAFQINMKVVATSEFVGYVLNLSGVGPGGARAFSDGCTIDFS
jgi:uncharacterized protein